MTEKTIERALGIHRYGAGERCVVSHPDAGGPCGQPATILVWELPFCAVHGAEAEAGALTEIFEDTETALRGFAGMENERHHTNPLLACLGSRPLKSTPSIGEMRSRYDSSHQEALREAYPVVEGRIDPDILAFDYEDDCVGTPVDWWWEMHGMITQFMRLSKLSKERGACELIKMLEPLRERACAQVVLAEDDQERRWAAPRRAKRAEEVRGAVDGG